MYECILPMCVSLDCFVIVNEERKNQNGKSIDGNIHIQSTKFVALELLNRLQPSI